MTELSLSAVPMQDGETRDALHIDAVLTGQPGNVTFRVRDRSGRGGSSHLAPDFLDITLCAAPATAQVDTYKKRQRSASSLASFTPEVLQKPVGSAPAHLVFHLSWGLVCAPEVH